jgi:hypothetical protein
VWQARNLRLVLPEYGSRSKGREGGGDMISDRETPDLAYETYLPQPESGYQDVPVQEALTLQLGEVQ